MTTTGDDPETSPSAVVSQVTQVTGVVEQGDQRGRLLGFPTANLSPGEDADLLVDGVYAGWCWQTNGSIWQAAISIGRRPTFYRDEKVSLLVEAHLIGFDGDLYGERITIQLTRRLRNQVRFDSVEELIVQLRDDIDRTRRLLSPAEVQPSSQTRDPVVFVRPSNCDSSTVRTEPTGTLRSHLGSAATASAGADRIEP